MGTQLLADLAQLLHLDQPLHQDHHLDLMKTQLMAVNLTKWQSEFKVFLETSAPSSINGQGECALKTTSGEKYCAVICDPTGTAQCNPSASMTCKSIQGTGICTYDDTMHVETMLIGNPMKN